jgi:exodeoxyribonuclease-5
MGGERIVTIGGYAGTGKTTLIVALRGELGHSCCAYTGKAAHVLRQKGCDAETIHSLIYRPVDNKEAVQAADQRLQHLIRVKASKEDIEAAKDFLREVRRPKFILRDQSDLNDKDGKRITGFIVDEASMVPEPLYDDLLSFRLPCIFVGDHGQLPPVCEHGGSFNLMANPMYRLETLHRNAGAVARFAEHLRNGQTAIYFHTKSADVQLIPRGSMTTRLLMDADQVICPFNRSRVDFNQRIRYKLGRTQLLEVGDRVIALRNAREEGLYNGMQGTVTRVDLDNRVMDFVDECEGPHEGIRFDPAQFGQEKYEHRLGGPHPFDYGYVVTCHKAQGSEWGRVTVLDQGWKSEYPRRAYTAASRAGRQLTWVV